MKFFKILWHGMAFFMLTLIVIVVAVTMYSEFPINIDVVAAQCGGETCKDHDAIAIGYQLGRLDFVTAILGVLGIFLAVVGFIGFYSVKRSCEDIARQTINEFKDDKAPKLIEEMVRGMLPEVKRTCEKAAYTELIKFKETQASKIIEQKIESIIPELVKDIRRSYKESTVVEEDESEWGSNLDE